MAGPPPEITTMKLACVGAEAHARSIKHASVQSARAESRLLPLGLRQYLLPKLEALSDEVPVVDLEVSSPAVVARDLEPI